MKLNLQNCDLVFVRNSKLREHQSDKHTNTTTTTSSNTKQSSSTPSKQDSKYTCKLCGQVILFSRCALALQRPKINSLFTFIFITFYTKIIFLKFFFVICMPYWTFKKFVFLCISQKMVCYRVFFLDPQ